jgi:pimeloyl-ACP methyl ester carboxylesterase
MDITRIIDNELISNTIFYPRKTTIPENLDSSIHLLRLQIEKKIIIGGFLFEKDPHLPTLLLFHGNGEVALDYQYFFTDFFECDVNLAVVDFRGYGFSSGDPFYTSLISDAPLIYSKFEDWIMTEGMTDVIFVQGRSLGSACASEIGARSPSNLKGIIFESGFASTYNMMTRLFRVTGPEITPESLSKYSNDTRVRKFDKPVLIIHGTSDWIIPPSEAELLFNNIPDEVEKKLVLIEGAGHNNIFSFKEQYFSALKSFIQKYK